MKKFLFILKLFLCAVTMNFVLAENLCAAQKSQNVQIVNWNLQCFFDAETDGTEYAEYKKSKNWTKGAYEKRLERLATSIKTIKADIYVFEEVENSAVIEDIANRICDFSFGGRKNWNYGVFSKNPGDSIGCAVISRFPIKDCSIHNLDIRTENEKQPSMRAVMKVSFDADGKNLIVLVNHWKSKSGDAEKSEIWRNWQEENLAFLFKETLKDEKNVVACGDFNRDITEFIQERGREKYEERSENCWEGKENFKNQGGRTFELGNRIFPTLPENLSSEGSPFFSIIKVKNPWFDECENLLKPGSYYFNEEFERIDHFFLKEELPYQDFKALTGPWSSEEGIPERFQIFSGEGYSDHLPVSCTIVLE